jgi:hypothetical protein
MANRTIVVLTSALVKVHVQGIKWVASNLPSAEPKIQVDIYEDGHPDHPVAVFSDVHGIWFDNRAELIPPEN